MENAVYLYSVYLRNGAEYCAYACKSSAVIIYAVCSLLNALSGRYGGNEQQNVFIPYSLLEIIAEDYLVIDIFGSDAVYVVAEAESAGVLAEFFRKERSHKSRTFKADDGVYRNGGIDRSRKFLGGLFCRSVIILDIVQVDITVYMGVVGSKMTVNDLKFYFAVALCGNCIFG